VKRDAFLRGLRRYASTRGLVLEIETGRGKGSHYRVRLAGHVTTVQAGELTPFHVERLCKQLGIPRGEL
jgi:hypothetical protein